MIKNWMIEPVFDVAGGAGGGAEGGMPAPASGGAAGGGAAPAAGGGGSAPVNPYTGGGAAPAAADPVVAPAAAAAAGSSYYPDKLPDHLRGTNDRETIDKLFANASGLREELSKRGSVPDKPDAYKLELSPDLQKVFGDPTKDKGTQIFRSLASKHKLTAEQASGLYADWHGEVVSAGIVKPMDVMGEARKLVGASANGQTEVQLKEAAGARWNEANAWIDRLVSSKTLSADQALIGRALLESADGIMFLESLKGMNLQAGPQPGGQEAASITKDDLDRMNNDPRTNPHDPRFDPAYEKKVSNMFQQFYAKK